MLLDKFDKSYNTNKSYRLLYFLIQRNNSAGFTLLELLIVIMFLGILAALAIPNFLKQVGKAREVEFTNTIGTINRAQQTYHWEKNVFANTGIDTQTIQNLGLSFDNKYIDTYNFQTTSTMATLQPVNNEYDIDETRAYSGATFYGSGIYQVTICKSVVVTSQIAAPVSSNNCGVNELVY